MSPLETLIASRVQLSMADLLLAVADHFYCLGARITPVVSTDPGMADLLLLLEARYADLIIREYHAGRNADPDLRPDWLKRLAANYREPEQKQ